jgi:oligopeptidase B
MQHEPPIAAKQPHPITVHNHTRIDDYYWLNDRENPEVIAYLEAENTYTQTVMASTQALQNELFNEMKGRIKEDDSSVPVRIDNFWYYTRYEQGQEYPIYCRLPVSAGELLPPMSDEVKLKGEILLNVNDLAQNQEYCQIGAVNISPNHQYLAYTVDFVSRRLYTIFIKDLQTGNLVVKDIENTGGDVVWGNDEAIVWVNKDVETLREWQVVMLNWRTGEQKIIFEEHDETFYVEIGKSQSKKYVFVHSTSTVADEFHYLPTANLQAELQCFLPRQRHHEYNIDHLNGEFYVCTNWQAENFRLMKVAENSTQNRQTWQEVIPHRPEVLIEAFELFNDFLVIEERKDGLIQLQIIEQKTGKSHYLNFGEAAYLAFLDTNDNPDSPFLRYGYTSLTTPMSVFDYNMTTQEQFLLKRQTVLGDFDSNNYQSERIWATAKDGTKIPVSIVYHKNTPRNGQAPLLQYAYGSYGISLDANFNSARLSLLDRGFIYAIAHIRGGEELGRKWYENGKLLNKMNTFTDFIAVSEHLLAEGYTNKDKLFAMGGSAGGMLMGAVINLRPDLHKGVIAVVPFVDCITTMLDDSIPLTTFEYDEWGNPNEKAYYDYMLTYSPYDNVTAKEYPNLLVRTGLHDSQVQYWEPAKWVAKLRATKTDNNLLLLHTDMQAGHSGASGRFQRFKDIALDYAFLLLLLGKV